MIRYLVINVGCHECGVGHQAVGLFDTYEEAKTISDAQAGWRDGGQSIPEVLAIDDSWHGPFPEPVGF